MNGSASGAPSITINVSVGGTGGGVAVNDGNYPSWANATWQTCSSTSQCTLVPVTYCQNGAPQQSTCINQRYQSQYMEAYNASIRQGNGPKFCPLYILAVLKSCSCIQSTCTEVIGGGG